MARVIASDVTAILDTTIDLTAFIITANLIVTEELDGEGLSDARLKEIERYLVAHLACLKDPREETESFGDASSRYQGKTGMGLDATIYGQQVKILDSTGKLSRLNAPKARLEMI